MKRTCTLFTAGLLALLLVALGQPAVHAQPGGGAQGVSWTQLVDGPDKYPGISIQSDATITMSDGTVLRADIYRPADASGAPINEPMPTILNLTPYTKLLDMLVDAVVEHPQLGPLLMQVARETNLSGTPFDGVGELLDVLNGGAARQLAANRDLVQNGYVQVVADVRGTGYSQGIWDVFGAREQQDTLEVLDWITAQPWSNGSTGMAGISYSAINSLQAATHNPPSLEAIFPVEPAENLMRDIVATGGAAGAGFMPFWIIAVNLLKFLPSSDAILGGTTDPVWLADRMADPIVLGQDVVDALLFREGRAAFDGPFYDTINPDIERITVPTFIFGAYHDIFARGEVRAYQRLQLPAGQKKLVMGTNYHINPGYQMGRPGEPPRLDVLERAWFDKWIKGINNGIDNYGPIVSHQQGGGWTVTTALPRPGSTPQKLYLGPNPSGSAPHARFDGSLTAAPEGTFARATVAPGLRTFCSRDAAQGTAGLLAVLGSTCTQDSRFAEAEALTFTTAPFAEATSISGTMNLHLNTVTDAPEGFWAATVQDVAPDGTSTTINSGALLSSRRAVDDARSTKTAAGDYLDAVHRLTRDSLMPVVPGQPTVLDIDLRTTDALIKPGHRLRVDVYAASLPRYLPWLPDLAATGLLQQHLDLDPARPSFLVYSAN